MVSRFNLYFSLLCRSSFLITIPSARLSSPILVLGKVAFHFLLSFSPCTYSSTFSAPLPLPHPPSDSQVRALGTSCALKLRILSSLALPAFHTHSFPSKSLSGFLPSARLPAAAWSSVYAFAFPCLCSRPGHPSWALRHSLPATPPRALLAAFLGSASWLGAGSKERCCRPGSPVPAAGERTSPLNAATWAAPRAGVWRGLSLGQRPGVASGLQLPFLHSLGRGGMARGRWCPCRWVWKRLCGCCALVFLLRVYSETGSTTARVRGISAELEEKETWVLESPGYLQSVDDQSALAKKRL